MMPPSRHGPRSRRTAAEVFRSLPEYASSKDFAAQLRDLLDPGAN